MTESIAHLAKTTASSMMDRVLEHMVDLVTACHDNSESDLSPTDVRDYAYLCRRSREVVGVCTLRLATVRRLHGDRLISLLRFEKIIRDTVSAPLSDFFLCDGDATDLTLSETDVGTPFSKCECGGGSENCPSSHIHPRHEIDKAMAQALDSMKGLCLACFKQKGVFLWDGCDHWIGALSY